MRDIEHLQKLIERKRRAFSKKYCLHPDAPSGCSPGVAAAHSVQRAILKKHLAINGHVVQFVVSPQVDPVGLLAAPERIGINRATTFYGFCSAHDGELFRSLESSDLCFEPEQIALLGYRAVCRELYQKEAEIATAEAARSYAAVNPAIVAFKEKAMRDDILRMARINAKMNLMEARDDYASMLSDLTPLRYYALQFAASPTYLCSVAFLPEWDFEGNRLQDLSGIEKFRPLCFSAWAAGDQAAAVFCWHSSADAVCEPFVDSLRRTPHDRLANRILSMAFEISENVVFREDWWDNMQEEDRLRLSSRVLSGIGPIERHSGSLADDGLSVLGIESAIEHVHYGSAIATSEQS